MFLVSGRNGLPGKEIMSTSYALPIDFSSLLLDAMMEDLEVKHEVTDAAVVTTIVGRNIRHLVHTLVATIVHGEVTSLVLIDPEGADGETDLTEARKFLGL